MCIRIEYFNLKNKAKTKTKQKKTQKAKEAKEEKNLCGKFNGGRWYRLRIFSVYF